MMIRKVLSITREPITHATRSDAVDDEYEDEYEYGDASSSNVFSERATLFEGGSSSGDVIQGNLGDCWFLGEE